MAIQRPGNASLNRAHPLALNAVLACVADGRLDLLDYTTGERATIVGSPTFAYKPYLGKTITFVASGPSLKWLYNRPATYTVVSFFAICQFSTVSALNYSLLGTSWAEGGGAWIGTTATGLLQLSIGGRADIPSAITLVAGVPYAIGAGLNFSAGTISFVARRLDTGAVSTDTQSAAGSPFIANSGGFSLGGDTFGSGTANASVAAAAITTDPATIQTLLQWANDPWALFEESDAPTIGAPPAADPFGQTEWPNPNLGKASLAYLGHTWGQRLALTVPNVQPKQQRDWPNPTLPKYSKAYLGYTSNDRLALTVPNTMPFSQDDWQNPIIPQPNRTLPAHQATRVFVSADAVPDNQYDWVTPRLPKGVHPAYYGHTLQHNLALKVPNVQPFRQRDWQNPIQPRTLAHQGFVASTPLPCATTVQASPFSQDDWPNPRVPAPINLGFTANNITATTAPANPFAQYDWLNPRTIPSSAYLGFVNTLASTILGPNFPGNQDDWPNPIRPYNVAAYSGFTSNNTLALSVPNTEPFSQDDWPNPIRPWSTAVYQRWQRGLNLALNVANVEPFTQDDWPNPLLRPFSQAHLGTSNNLVTLIGPNVPFSQDDWPNPVRPAIPAVGFTQSALALGTFVQAPFTQADWPNLLLRPFAQAYLGFTSPNRLALTVPNVEPFAQDDWPNPILRLPPIHPVSASNVALPSAIVFVPHNQADWPNPILPVARAYQGHFVSGLALTVPNTQPTRQSDWQLPIIQTPAVYQGFVFALPPVTAPTFSQNDWPNPRPAQASYQGFASNATTLIGPNFPRPTIEWPNPIRTYSTAYQWASPSNLALLAPTPFAQDDWPNPIVVAQANRGFVAGGVPFVPAPFSQNDWPSPQPYSIRAYQGFVSNKALSTLAPFAQHDWPNPLRRIALGTVLVPINIRPLIIEAAGPIPFAQHDWPNYRSLRSPIYGFPLHHYNNVAIDKHADKTYFNHVHDPKANQTLLAASLAAISLRVVPPAFPATLLLPEAHAEDVKTAGAAALPAPLIRAPSASTLKLPTTPTETEIADSLKPFRKV